MSESEISSLYFEIQSIAQRTVHQFISNQFIDKYGISISIFVGIKKLINKSKIKNPFLLIDGNYNFKEKQKSYNFFFDYLSIVKGDSKIISIAAASIIAKYKRDEYMNSVAKKFNIYGFEKHKGYGSKFHIDQIKKYGYSKLHRKSFKIKEIENANSSNSKPNQT